MNDIGGGGEIETKSSDAGVYALNHLSYKPLNVLNNLLPNTH